MMKIIEVELVHCIELYNEVKMFNKVEHKTRGEWNWNKRQRKLT